MAPLIPFLIPLLLLAFWVWMLRDMLANDDIPGSSPTGLRWPPETKNHWIVFFILLNIFTAGYYYFTKYKRP